MVITVVARAAISSMNQQVVHDELALAPTTTTTLSQVQVDSESSSSSNSSVGSSKTSTTSTGPTNHQQQQQEHQREHAVGCGEEEDDQVSAANNNLAFVSPLAASFSFNSYQDILCSASGPGSAFSAADVKQTLSNTCNSAINSATSQTFKPNLHHCNGRRIQHQQHYQQQLSSSPTRRANFRVHSRQKSIGKLNELTSPIHFSVVNLIPIEQRSTNNYSQPVGRTIQATDKLDQPATSVHSLQDQGTKSRTDQSRGEKYGSRGEMSQTIQSIQSLSLQLNQAANLRGSSLSELSQMSSSGPQSPNGLANNQQQGNFVAASSGKLTRLVGKKATRVKELVLQNLGKADRTTDELFQMYEENFYKQQSHALKLQKEFKTYVATLKVSQESSKSLNSCIQLSTGEYQSARHDLVCENLSQLEHLNEDLMEKLRGQVLISVNEYTSQFNKLREKIAKRKRKLIDYDSSKRVYELMLATINKKRAQMLRAQQEQQQQQQQPQQQQQARTFSRFMLGSGQPTNQAHDSIQSATNQLVDEARLLKLREQYNYCKIMYETINSELYEELPMVYEKKMKHLLMTLQNYFSLEAQFHSNAGKLFATASDVIDELPMSIHHQRHSDDRHQSSNMNNSSSGSHTNVHDGDVLEYNNKAQTSGSSGMGSSRGDSSLESSSSPDGASSSGNSSPATETRQQVRNVGNEYNEDEANNEQVGDDEEGGAVVVVVDKESAENEVAKKEQNISVSPLDSQGQIVEVLGNVETPSKVQESSSVACTDEVVGPNSNYRLVEQNKRVDSRSPDQTVLQQVMSNDLQEELKAAVKGKEALKKEKSKLEVEDRNNKNFNHLYKVKTSYKYLAEDVDELCFEAGEIIQVIEFDETEEQEEGWLKGIRELNNQVGLFPANFTQPI